MSTRAKFKVDKIEITKQATYPERNTDGSIDYSKPEYREMRSIFASPVYANNDPNHENTKFWQASPSGSFVLGTVNMEAVKGFDPGVEFYIDLTVAE